MSYSWYAYLTCGNLNQIFYMGDELYGCNAEVVGVQKVTYAAPPVKLFKLIQRYPEAEYVPQHFAARELGMPNSLVSKITSSCQVWKRGRAACIQLSLIMCQVLEDLSHMYAASSWTCTRVARVFSA